MSLHKTIVGGLGVFALSLGSASFSMAQETTTIRINHANADDLGTDQQMFSWIFANYINEKSDTLDARIFPSGGLGESREVLEGMQLGAGASVHIGGAAELANFSERVGVLGLPFVWKDYEHVHRVMDGEVGDALKGDLEREGFKVLTWGDSWGYRNVVTTKKEITEPEGLAGLKIRTIPTKVFVATVDLMGASATPMDFGEIYTSLESGVLDGLEHTAATIITSQFDEVACCLAKTEHLFDPTALTYSLNEWESLTSQEQNVVQEAADLAADVVRALAPLREAESLDFLADSGMTVTDVNTDGFRNEAISVQDELAAELGAEDLLALIRDEE